MQDLKFDIQLFSEDAVPASAAAPAEGAASSQSTNVANTGANNSKVAAYADRARKWAQVDSFNMFPDAGQQTANQPKPQEQVAAVQEDAQQDVVEEVQPQEVEETFESLIGKNGKYEKEYNAKLSTAIKGRLKNSKHAEEKLRELAPLIDRIAENFGVKIDDIYKLDTQDLISRFDKDTRLIADEADANGKDPEDLAAIRALERQTKDRNLLAAMDQQAELQRQAEQEQEQRIQRIDTESKALKQQYPSFDLGIELQNEKFKQFLSSGLSIKDAYEATHIKELMSGGMKYAASKAEEKVAGTIKANQKRPTEAGMTSSASASNAFPDFANMPTKEFRKLIEEVKRGKRISF